MKFKINRDHFASGLQQVMNVVGQRATMPILSNVLLEAADGQLALTTTNLDMGIRCKIAADVFVPGSLTLPVRKLASIVRELPSLEVEVDATNGTQAKLVSNRSQFRLMGIAGSEFPPLPTFTDQHSFILSQADLVRMLKSVSYAQSSDETRYIMNGVFFNFAEDRLTLAATDGRRLSLISKEVEVTEENQGHLILPAKTVAEVERLLNQGETVRIAFNDRQVAFEINTGEDSVDRGLVDSVYLVSKVVEGTYPNYRQVIPKENDQHIKINRELFYNTIRRAAVMVSDKNNSVKIHVADNLMTVSSASSEYGEGSDSQAVEYSGPEVTVAFNPAYLIDPLRALSKDEVIFEFKDELSPGVIRTTDSFLCVIMPLRLS